MYKFCFQYTSLASSIAIQSTILPSQMLGATSGPGPSTSNNFAHPRLRGALSQAEGPLRPMTADMYSSLQSSTSLQGSLAPLHQGHYDEGTLEMLSHDMSFSALYLHDRHFKKSRGLQIPFSYSQNVENNEDLRAQAMWSRHDEAQTMEQRMPDIEETGTDEENELRGDKQGQYRGGDSPRTLP